MAAKKQKPALYELVNKGNLSTPGWFYRSKKAALEKLKKQSQADNSDAKPSFDVNDATTAMPDNHSPAVTRPVARPAPVTNAGALQTAFASLKSGTLFVRMPYWCAGLIILALIAMFLTAYWLGQNSIINSVKKASQSVGNKELTKIKQGPVTPGLVPYQAITKTVSSRKTTVFPQKNASGNSQKSLKNNQNPALSGQKTTKNNAKNTPVSGQQGEHIVNSQIENPQCLIICGASSSGTLMAVQNYFNNNGLPTSIRKFGSRYVLVTQEVFSKTDSSRKNQLLQIIADTGISYNKNKAPNDPVFSASTFKGPNGPFAVSVKKIR